MIQRGTPNRRSFKGYAFIAVGVALMVGALAVGTFKLLQVRPAYGHLDSMNVREEVPVTSNDLRQTRAQNSAVMLVDPTDDRFAVVANRLDAPEFACSLQVSGDGGRSWLPADPVPELPAGAEKCYAPEIAFDGDGTLYYLFVGLSGTGNSPMGVFLTSSSDRGQSFAPPVQVLGAQNYQVRMAVDRAFGEMGRIHLVWLQTTGTPPLGGLPPPPNPIVAAHSDDGGKSFSQPVPVSDADRKLAVAPAIALGADGRVHVLYYDLQDDFRDYRGLEGPVWEGNWSLVHTSSSDGGRQFSEGVVVDDELLPPERVMLIYTMPPPALAADGAGRVYAAWYDGRNGDWDVFLRPSPDEGATWEGRRQLNDDPPGRHQYLPALSTAPDGRVDAIFYDRRDDVDNVRNDVYYTFSTDGGVRFSPNVELTSSSSSSRVGQIYLVPSAEGLIEFGARIALFSLADSALASWTDTRNAGDSVQQDIYATEVEFPTHRQAGLVVPTAVFVGGLLSLVLGLLLRRRYLAMVAPQTGQEGESEPHTL
ncbi:MAG TPA: sialidase family protein [Chloroflexota bacterium]|nr:sialidase family protein [Chloroflexota bacterium]